MPTPSQEYRDAQTASLKQLEATTSGVQAQMAANSAKAMEAQNKQYNSQPEAYHIGQVECFYLPSAGGQVKESGKKDPSQSSPLLQSYSPRLIGAPPQLSHLCDMRLTSSDGSKPGAVGDFYLNEILRDSQIANIMVGKALFVGGMSTFGEVLRNVVKYGAAFAKYNIYGTSGNVQTGATSESISSYITEERIKQVMENDTTMTEVKNEETGEVSYTFGDDEAEIEKSMKGIFGSMASAVVTPLLQSMKVQQPYYVFESDWNAYINNVKMMINTAVIMLGLQKACVRIGDKYLPIGMDTTHNDENDAWANYRFITPTKGFNSGDGTKNQLNTFTGETSQYISVMVEPGGVSESYENQTGESQIYANVIKQGEAIGNEIAFLTGASQNRLDDAVINLMGGAANAAEAVVSNLTLGAGKFTAAVVGSMSRAFIGDHTIYPEIFQRHNSNKSGITLKTHLVANGGDPYSFLTECMVPLSFLLCTALPSMSKNSSAAYAYPPLVQCALPGVFGTRLGIVTNIQVTKNVDGKSMSINGFPTSIDVSITIRDLENVLVTSPMNEPARFLNNNTMFDYIAQTCGCDKYKPNGALRLVSKLALTASASNDVIYNLGSAMANDFASMWNTKISQAWRTR